MSKENQIKSKERVRDKGEVFTNEREVNAMLDLVKNETERIDSRFLEPACGSGNFLVEVLRRKLFVVKEKYKKSQTEYERNSLIALSSIYGVDIMEDNVEDCRKRLLNIYSSEYTTLFKSKVNVQVLEVAEFMLEKNILCGDALTMLQTNGDPIVFAEWTAVNGVMMKRKDYTLAKLLESENINSLPLFNDLAEPVYIPKPIKEFPAKHYLRLAEDR